MSTFGSLMGGDNPVKQYLTFMSVSMPAQPGFKYGSFAAYFLDKGQPVPGKQMPAAWQKEMMALVKAVKPTAKECFWNAERFVRRDPKRFEYWEGFAQGIIPVHHAWVVERSSGALIDPTLRLDFTKGFTASNLSIGLAKRVYFGCGFPWSKVQERGGGSLVDWYQAGFPELRG